MVRPNSYRFKHGSSRVVQSVWTSGEALEPSQLDNELIQDLLNQLWATTPLYPPDAHSTSLTWSILPWFSLLYRLHVLLSMQMKSKNRIGLGMKVQYGFHRCHAIFQWRSFQIQISHYSDPDCDLWCYFSYPIPNCCTLLPHSRAPLRTATKVIKLAHHCIDLTPSYV